MARFSYRPSRWQRFLRWIERMRRELVYRLNRR